MNNGLVFINRNEVSVNTMSSSTLQKLRKSVSENTIKSYKCDLKAFNNWLLENGIDNTLPHSTETVCNFMAWCDDQDYALSTIERRIQAISWIHRKNEFNSPTKHDLVSDLMAGIRNGRAQDGRKTTVYSKQPVTSDIIRGMVSECDLSDITGIRDKALLLVGFASALRRSELTFLKMEDITILPQGADIVIRKSKTDQAGKGEMVCITRSGSEFCPVAALVEWIKAAGIRDGFIFRRISSAKNVLKYGLSDKTVANKVKEYASKAGYNPAAVSGHSLRSGMLTSAAENGADLIPLAQHARHKNVAQTMHYIREANRYKNNPTDGLL